MKLKIKNLKSKIILLVTSYSLLVTVIGCDAFVRKFTRKPKRDKIPQEEMVLAPAEYKGPQMTKEELYRRYFLFWKSWQDELIESLLNRSQKKQIDCAEQAIDNLNNLKTLLNKNGQKKLDVYIAQLNELLNRIHKDLYGSRMTINYQTAQRIKRNILRDFSYNKISEDISYGDSY